MKDMTGWRNKADQRAVTLYAEYDRIMKLKMPTPLSRFLPPLAIDIRRARASTTFRLIREQGYWRMIINERLWGLNSRANISAAFRHNLIHLYQEATGRRQSHTRFFLRLETEIEGMDDALLRRPEPQTVRFIYVCPCACQEFSSEDSVSVDCVYCGSRMRSLGPQAYRKYDLERKAKAAEQLEAIKKRDDDEGGGDE